MSVHVWGEVPIGSVEQFLEIFSTEGKTKRAEHGCLGARVFTPVGQSGTVFVLLEWPDEESFEAFGSDPTAPPIMRKGGAQGPPTFTVLDLVSTVEA